MPPLYLLHCAGQEILVPLTSSLYVPGRLGSRAEVLVDVGTGFFVGKSVEKATAIMSSKAEMVRKEADKLGKVISVKQSNLEIIESNLQSRASGAE